MRNWAGLHLWNGFRLVLFGQSQQLAGRQFEELCDVEHSPESGALLTPLDLTDVAEMIAERMSKILLSHATLGAQLRHHPSEGFFGGMGDAFDGCSDGSGHIAMVSGVAVL
jgi:hypothetical protein